MMDVLLAALPSFAENWDRFRREWTDEADLPMYPALSDFARHVIGFLETKDHGRLRNIFEAVERLHVEGDRYVREAATVGLLEGMQNRNLHRTTDPEQFRPFLGPASLKCWDRLNLFWDGDARALHEHPGGEAAGPPGLATNPDGSGSGPRNSNPDRRRNGQ